MHFTMGSLNSSVLSSFPAFSGIASYSIPSTFIGSPIGSSGVLFFPFPNLGHCVWLVGLHISGSRCKGVLRRLCGGLVFGGSNSEVLEHGANGGFLVLGPLLSGFYVYVLESMIYSFKTSSRAEVGP